MKPRLIRKLVTGALCAFALNLQAQNGTWINTGGGSWANSANWNGGTIASGSGGTADFSTLTLASAPTVTLDGARTVGNLILGDQGNTYGWTLNTGGAGPLTLAGGTPTITVNGQTNTIGLVLAGTAGMTKAGAGTLVLTNNANTYTGGTTVSAGTLQIGLGAAPIGTINGPYSIGGSATLKLFRTATVINSNYNGSGTLWLQGSTTAIDFGQVALTNNNFTGTVVIGAGRLYNNIAGANTYLGAAAALQVNSGGEFGVFAAGASYNVPISIAGIGSTIDATPYGAIRLDAGGTWSGPITLTANARIANHNESVADTISGTISGPYQLELFSDNGNATGKQMSLSPSAQNTYGSTEISGTIVAIAKNTYAFSTGGLLMNAGTIELNGNNFSFANLSGTSGVIENGNASTASVITVGSDGTSTIYGSTLVNGSTAALGLTKTGAGTLTLTGANTYTGPTLVSAGKLVVSSAQTGTGSMTVNDDVALGVTVSGTNQLSPATLTLGTSSGPTTNEFTGLTSTSLAPINTTTLAITGPTTINILSGFFVTGQIYPLIHFTTLTGTGGFVLGSVPAGMTGAAVITNGSTIALSVAAFAPPTNLWTGAISGNWDKSTANWTTNGVAATYSDYNVVRFDDTATGPTSVTNTVTVLPEAVVFNNTNLSYTISGSPISGGGTLTLLGTGTLTLSGNNTYTGGTVVNAGTLNLAKPNNGNNSALGNGLVTVNTNGAITVTTNNTLATGGSQSPSLAVNGGTINAGAFDIQFINLTMNGGTLTANNGTSYSWFSYGDVTINANATGASIGGNSPWYMRNANHNTIFNVAAGGSGNDLTVASALVADGSGGGQLGLVKAGNGVMTINGACTYAGTTTVSNGTLVVNGSLAAGSAVTVQTNALLTGSGTIGGTVTVQNGGTVNGACTIGGAVTVQSGGAFGGTGTISGATTIQSGGTLTVGTTATNTGTLTVNNSLSLAGVTVMKISKNGNIPSYDQVTGLAGATFGGTLIVTNITSDGSSLANGDTFYLFNKSSGSYGGSFTSILLPPRPSGLSWDLSQLAVSGSIALAQSAAPPAFNPPGGGYESPQNVTMTSDSGSTIFYTTDGSTPTSSSPHGPSPLTLALPANTAGLTLSAYATNTGYAPSVVVSATYATVPVPTWMQPSGGAWSSAGNWSNNVIADGGGVTADLSELTLPSDLYVTLDISSTVGSLLFGDAGTNYNTYVEPGGGTLTLEAGTNAPVVNVVNQAAEMDAPLAGANGLVKTGAGTLTLAGANSYTGTTTVSNSMLQLGNGTVNGAFGSGPYNLATNTTLRLNYATASAPVWPNIVGAGTLDLTSAQAVNGTANWCSTNLNFSPAFTGNLLVENGRVMALPGQLGGMTSIEIGSGAQFMCIYFTNLPAAGVSTNLGTYNIPITIAGDGWGESAHPEALRLAAGCNATWAGAITLSGDSGICAQANTHPSFFTISGTISGNYQCEFYSEALALLSVAPAAAVQNSHGINKISGGGVVAAGNAFAFSTNGLWINGGTLQLNGSSFSFANLSGTSGQVQNGNATTNSVLTVGADDTSTEYDGTLVDGGAASLGLTWIGAGTLTLTATNTYSGPTLVNGGTLALTGGATLTNSVLIGLATGATLDVTGTASGILPTGPGQTLAGYGTVNGSIVTDGNLVPGGTNAIGTLTVNANATLAGTTVMEVNNSAATNAQLNVSGTLTYGGTLVINNVSAAPYTNNQVIQLFNAASYTGAFANIVFPGVATYNTNNLDVNGTVQVLTLAPTVATNPTNINASVSSGQINLSWPADHTGWRLLVQTNNLANGISGNPNDWMTVSGSAATNRMIISIINANRNEFYRLVYP